MVYGLFAAVHGVRQLTSYFDRSKQLTLEAVNERDQKATFMAAAVFAGTATVAAGKYIFPKFMDKCLNCMAKS